MEKEYMMPIVSQYCPSGSCFMMKTSIVSVTLLQKSCFELHAAFFAPNNDDSISSKTFRYQWRRDTVVGANSVTRLYLGLLFHHGEITAVLASWKSCCEV